MKKPISPIVATLRLAVSKLSAAAQYVSLENSTTNSAGRHARATLRSFLLAIGAVATLLAAAPVQAQVLPPGGTYYGKTYGQWSEAWFQWGLSLPVTHSPYFDTADASEGQSGSVWFLACESGTRYATIPGGIALFFPVVAWEADDADCNGSQRVSDGYTEAQLRTSLKNYTDTAHNLSCMIDGVAVAGLEDVTATVYRVPSPTPGGFSYTLPGKDNYWASDYPCWANSTGAPITVEANVYHPVADGCYLLVAPLAPGPHTIYCHGELGTPVTSSWDKTFYLTVTPPMLSIAPQGTNVVISWPQTGSSNVLESASLLGSTNWSTVDATNQTVGDSYRVTLPVSGSNHFFRLRQSP